MDLVDIDDLVSAAEGLVLDGIPKGADIVDARFEAPSISSTSTERSSSISLQESHLLQGSGVMPTWQLRALARIRARVVLPTPRMPRRCRLERRGWS